MKVLSNKDIKESVMVIWHVKSGLLIIRTSKCTTTIVHIMNS